jgi:hypothetical protein
MIQNTRRTFLFLFVFVGLASCSPKNEFDKFISQEGYIPFQQPLADLGVGSLITGSPNQLRIVAPPKRCFPDLVAGIPTEIRQITAADIPEIVKKISFGASSDINVIAANGNPLFKINPKFQALKSLEVKIDGASVEYLDELVFADLVNSSMNESCKTYLKKGGSFIRQALRVDKMSFQFKNESSGTIDLTLTKLKDIIDIEADVHWELTDNYTLTITTPKYIGYHLAKTSPQDPASLAWIANSLTKDGTYDFKPVNSYRWFQPSLMLR